MSDDDRGEDLYAVFNDGLALYAGERWFEAHEAWEHAWGGEVGRTKLVLQALIQIAAALTKHRDGNARGPSKLLAKALDKIEEIRGGCSAWLGVDLVQLEEDVRAALARADAIARGEEIALPAPRLPRVVGPSSIVYLHGFASGPSSTKASILVPPLVRAGWHVAVPDLNEGDFEHLTVTRAIACASRHLRERTLVVGSSFGAYAAALLAERDDRVKGLVLMAPAFGMAERLEARHGPHEIERWRARGKVDVEHFATGRAEAIGFGLIEDARRHPSRPRLRVPTYVLHGARDDVVPAEVVREVVEASSGRAELDLVDDDHGLVGSIARAEAAIQRMISRLGLTPDPPPTDEADALARWAPV